MGDGGFAGAVGAGATGPGTYSPVAASMSASPSELTAGSLTAGALPSVGWASSGIALRASWKTSAISSAWSGKRCWAGSISCYIGREFKTAADPSQEDFLNDHRANLDRDGRSDRSRGNFQVAGFLGTIRSQQRLAPGARARGLHATSWQMHLCSRRGI